MALIKYCGLANSFMYMLFMVKAAAQVRVGLKWVCHVLIWSILVINCTGWYVQVVTMSSYCLRLLPPLPLSCLWAVCYDSSHTACLALPGWRAMHVRISAQAKYLAAPGAFKGPAWPCVAWSHHLRMMQLHKSLCACMSLIICVWCSYSTLCAHALGSL